MAQSLSYVAKMRNAVGRSAKITANMSSMTSTAQLARETFLDAHASLLATFLEATKLPASCVNAEEILYLCKRPKDWIFVCLSRVARITNTTNYQLTTVSIDNCLSFVCGRRKAQHHTHSLPPRHKAFWTRLLTARMQLQIGSNKNGRPSHYIHIQQPFRRLVPTAGIHQSMARVPRSIYRQAT